MARRLRLLRSRSVVAVAIGTLIPLILIGARELGQFEALELAQYDRYIRRAAEGNLEFGPVALVRIYEEDIQKYGHPLSDELLTLALGKLVDAGPRAIGVDLYREAPVPRKAGGLGGTEWTDAYRKLGEFVVANDSIVMVMTAPGDGRPFTPPPSFLNTRDQIGSADVPVDRSGAVRRALLYVWVDPAPVYTLSLQLAKLYFGDEDMQLEQAPENENWVRFGETTIPPFEQDHGAYVGADSLGYQFLISFRTGAVGPPSISVSELIEGNFDPELLRDKVVFLGVSSASVKDEFYTPMIQGHQIGGTMSGIELHANVVAQLIRFARGEEQPLRVTEREAVWAWIWLWGMLGAGLAILNRSAWASFVVAAVTLWGLVELGHQLYALGWWMPVVPPAIAGVVSVGFTATALAVIERSERREVTGLFSRFLRPSVAEEIWRHREEFMSGTRRVPSRRGTLTALMSDLEAYTSTAEKLEPEAFMAWISEYMDTMAEEVERHQGVVDDYAGDGIKANFGFPVLRSERAEIVEDAIRAVSCALSMGQRMTELNASWSARGLPTGRCRVGISTGTTVVGCIGSDESLKYTSVGSTINTAARLEGFHKDEFKSGEAGSEWRILISADTAELLPGVFELEDLGLHELRGKPGKVRIFRVRGHANEAHAAAASGAIVSPIDLNAANPLPIGGEPQEEQS